jgi:adenosylcobinamide-phosphate synthase
VNRDAWSGYRGRALAVAAALAADRLLGEPPVEPHPVAAFGTAMTRLEHAIHADDRRVGALYTATGTLIGAVAGAMMRSTLAATYLSVAGRALADAADAVAVPLALDDLDGARHQLRALVGRNTDGLDAAGIARAVIESVAENTSDAVIGPALWGALAGAPGTLAYRAVNTMDAMVGHHSARYEHFGWASARLDDAANWVPARLTAVLVALARPRRAGAVWRAVRRDAPAHPSPNAGVVEAAFAASLGLRLGGVVAYGDRIEHRPTLGTGRIPEPGDIAAAVGLAAEVERQLAVVLLVTALTSFITRPVATRRVKPRRVRVPPR